MYKKEQYNSGMFAIILNEEKEILLCHRRDYDLWNLPGGGLEKQETPEIGVIREVKEETGFDVKVVRLIGVYTKKDKNELVFSYLCRIVGGKEILNDEADEIRYFAVDKIPKNFSIKQLERIKDYFSNHNKVYYKVQTGKSSIELLKNI